MHCSYGYILLEWMCIFSLLQRDFKEKAVQASSNIYSEWGGNNVLWWVNRNT